MLNIRPARLTPLAHILAVAPVLSLAACEAAPPEEAPEQQGQALAASCNPGPNQIALYVHGNFQGGCAVFNGPEAYHGWEAGRFPNDAASSVAVGANVSVILFSDGGLNGAAAHFAWSGNIAGWMNDRTSSFLIVSKARDCSFNPGYQPRQGEVAVWDEANFAGLRCHVYRADESLPLLPPGEDLEVQICPLGFGECFEPMGLPGLVPLPLFAVKNDTISSLKVGPNTVVTLYEHAEYQGRALAGFGSGAIPFVGAINDMTSSLAIGR